MVLVVNHVGPYGTEIDRMRREVTAARKPRRRREFLRRRFLKMNTFGANVCCSITAVTEAPATYGCVERSSAPLRFAATSLLDIPAPQWCCPCLPAASPCQAPQSHLLHSPPCQLDVLLSHALPRNLCWCPCFSPCLHSPTRRPTMLSVTMLSSTVTLYCFPPISATANRAAGENPRPAPPAAAMLIALGRHRVPAATNAAARSHRADSGRRDGGAALHMRGRPTASCTILARVGARTADAHGRTSADAKLHTRAAIFHTE